MLLSLRRLLLLLVLPVAFFAFPAASQAAGLSVSVVTWDIIGVKSNNTGLSTGPGPGFPVGVKVCNSSGGALTGVQTSFAFTSSNANISLSSPSSDPIGSLADGACDYSYYSVDVNRVSGARGTNRSYQISASSTEGSSGATGTRTLYVQSLISQNRNTTHKISGPGGCNATYTVCDPAPTNLVVGNTYTYKLYAETSTGYEQVEAFLAVPGAIFRTESVSSEYQTPSGATVDTPYANACGWTMNGALANFGSCTGPIVAPWSPGGKAGNKMVVTYQLKVIGTGSGSMTPLIYDFSGGSFHYNSDYGDATYSVNYSAAVKYPLDATVSGNGNVTSSPGSINCGTGGAACSQDFDQNQVVTLTATPGGGDSFQPGSSTCPGSTWAETPPSSGIYTCVVTMDAAKSATASFSGTTYYPLDVQTTGAGSVVSVSNPNQAGQIQCSLTTFSCAESYPDGALVTLFATPDSGNAFDPATSVCPGTGWASIGGGAYTCDTTMSQARSATAVFNPVLPTLYNLTVSVTAGTGAITSSPGTIDCDQAAQPSCVESFNDGTSVTLTATPGAGQRFVSGTCPGTAQSNGCIRLSDGTVRLLNSRLALGSPVRVRG